MTEKFKNAVKDIVSDGIVTPEEEILILNLAKEEGISENDAKIYLASEKKKVKEKKEDKSEEKTNWEKAKPVLSDIGKGVIAVAGFIGTALTVFKEFNDLKDNKFRSKK